MEIQTEQIQCVRDEEGKIIAFWISDMKDRHTNMYTAEKVSFDEVKEVVQKLLDNKSK